MCIESGNTATERYCRVHTLAAEFLVYGMWYGGAAGDLHRRRQDSDLEDASSDRTDIASETGHGSVTAMTGPNEVTVYTVRVRHERIERWRIGVFSLKCENETAEITLLNTVDRTRRVKTITRNTTRYSHDSLGHCESSIKEGETAACIHIPHVESRPQMGQRQTCCMDDYTTDSQR